jgi:hypothetical protein
MICTYCRRAIKIGDSLYRTPIGLAHSKCWSPPLPAKPSRRGKPWSTAEMLKLFQLVEFTQKRKDGRVDWRKIARELDRGRLAVQNRYYVMRHASNVSVAHLGL